MASQSKTVVKQLSDGVKTVICVDISGSTGPYGYYDWVKCLVASMPDAHIIEWNDKAEMSNHHKLNQRTSGTSGTTPSCFLPLIKDYDVVMVITDGEIGKSEVTNCETILANRKQFKFKHVIFHFYATGGTMDLSVSAAFARDTKFELYKHTHDANGTSVCETLAEADNSTAMDFQQYYDNPELFMQDVDKLRASIVMRQIGKNTANAQLKEQVVALQSNLRQCLLNRNSSTADFALMRKQLLDGNSQQAIDTIKSYIQVDPQMTRLIDMATNRMISDCDRLTGFSFDLLQPGWLKRAAVVQNVDANDLPDNTEGNDSEENVDFECPISFDTDVPTLLIKTGPPVLTSLPRAQLDRIMLRPFEILDDMEIVKAITNRIGSVIGFSTQKSLLGDRDPFQGVKFSSSIVINSSDLGKKYNRKALADIFFGNKLVGVAENWMAILYLIFNRSAYFTDDATRMPFVEAFRSYMMTEMRNTMVPITLSPFNMDPMVKAPCDIAMWYCVSTPFITNYQGKSNRVRDMGLTSLHMMDIVQEFGYPFDRAATERLASLYEVFDWMQTQERDPQSQWRNLIRTQWQNYLIVNPATTGTIVMLDGPCAQPIPLPTPLNRITLQEVVKLMNMVNGQVANFTIPIYREFDASDVHIPQPVNNYGYDYSNMARLQQLTQVPIAISPLTMRPMARVRSSIDAQVVDWEVEATRVFGPVSGQISAYNRFRLYVAEEKSYPTKDEFILYCARKEANSDVRPRNTLPAHFSQTVNRLFLDFEAVLGVGFQNVTPRTFNTLTYNSMNKETRSNIDQSDRLR
jgi:hypothetical protein